MTLVKKKKKTDENTIRNMEDELETFEENEK